MKPLKLSYKRQIINTDTMDILRICTIAKKPNLTETYLHEDLSVQNFSTFC